jgi:hypothetical protein
MSSVSGDVPVGLKRKKINAFNVLILCFVGLGSMSYGYTASVIGQTLVSINSAGAYLYLPADNYYRVNQVSSNISN